MRFDYRCIDEWPPLAWIARVRPNELARVWHGRRVETRPDWFCEAVWPGSFDAGDFDTTDLVAGTGGRWRKGRLIFVAPGNTVDRIVSLRIGGVLWVSNSVACLLAVTGAVIDPAYPRYYEDFATIVGGLTSFKRTLATSLGDMRITMYGFLTWEGGEATDSVRNVVQRDFGTYAAYTAFLRENLSSLARNIADSGRRHRYRFMATVSSGYDSPAVAALAHEAGCEESLCIDTDRSGEPEHGDRVAAAIGLQCIPIVRNAWKELEGREILFVAADGTSEAVPIASAGASLAGRVLLTGYHGDKVWAKDTKDLSANIVRGDSSGLSLSEFRLWEGFIHCPLAFWGVRQISDISRLSNADEMRPWDIPGEYSRPIPRRIVESAGVPRDAFGRAKKASAVAFSEFLGPAALRDYRAWLSARRIEWMKRGRLPPPTSELYEYLAGATRATIEATLHRTPLLWRFAPENALDRPSRLRRHAFAWAVGEVSARYLRHVDEHFDTEPGEMQR